MKATVAMVVTEAVKDGDGSTATTEAVNDDDGATYGTVVVTTHQRVASQEYAGKIFTSKHTRMPLRRPHVSCHYISGNCLVTFFGVKCMRVYK